MSEQPEFLTTKEIAALLRVRERKVYDLAAEGAIPHRRVTGKLLFPRAEVEAWIAGGVPVPGRTAQVPDVIAGSHDPLLDWAIRQSASGLATLFDGSTDGLVRMQTNQAIATGLHVYEPGPGNGWNVATTDKALGQAPVVLIEWARRARGLILARPLAGKIKGLADLAGHRIARRQSAAGASILFDHLAAEAGLTPDAQLWSDETARTETEAATAVAGGQADAALGLEAMARQFDLPFVPLIDERFDLAVDRRAWFEKPMQRLLGFASLPEFRAKAEHLGGYDISGLATVHWNSPVS